MFRLIAVLFVVFFPLVQVFGQTRVLYDDTHAQQAGNADWVINGAYSDMADMLKDNGFQLENLSSASSDGIITSEVLRKFKAVILAEPNNPYSCSEQDAIVDYVNSGGGLFIIGDHEGADRNGNGWDAVRVFNEFTPKFGFTFAPGTFSEAPLSGPSNRNHPVMYRVKAMGAWAAATFALKPLSEAKVVPLQDSRYKKAPYVVASQVGQGRVVAIGDSSPFDDGTGSGGKNKLHDSYDSFMYSHPQLAYNAMTWVSGKDPAKVVPSRSVEFHDKAKLAEKHLNLLIDASHGNQSSDKMQTFEIHARKLGFKVFYSLNMITPTILAKFSIVFIPEPSLPFTAAEAQSVCDWLMAGGRMVLAGSWDSTRTPGRKAINFLLSKIGSAILLNDDQVWDNKHKTNKPWGVIAKNPKKGHPVSDGVNAVITWGTCSLITRDQKPLTESAGVEILLCANPTSFNKDGDKKNNAIIYPSDVPIALVAVERLATGLVVVSGCSNFTDYQYPDSYINASLPGPSPVKHETPLFFDNMLKYLSPTKDGRPDTAR